MEQDRQLWLTTIEKWMDRVQRGAIYFVSKSLWNVEKIDTITYPINHVLKFFNSHIGQSTQLSLIIEILTAIKFLIQCNEVKLFFEWATIIKILNSSITYHAEEIVSKQKTSIFGEIFKYIKQLILTNEFPDFATGDALKCYFEYKSKRIVVEKTLT